MSNNDLVTRTLLLSKKRRGTLLVSRGVPDGDELRAETLSNGLSQIRAFNLNNLTTSASAFPHTYSFNTEGQVLGWGLRNSVGVAEHPVTGGIFAVENSMDGVTRNKQDIHENNPAEELNYLGVLGKDEFGKNYGFPSCFAVWDLDEIPENAGLKVGDQFATDEDKITDEVCNDSGKYEKPRLVMPAHWAPLDIKFDGKGEVAYVSFHGSCKSLCFFVHPYPSTTPFTSITSLPFSCRSISLSELQTNALKSQQKIPRRLSSQRNSLRRLNRTTQSLGPAKPRRFCHDRHHDQPGQHRLSGGLFPTSRIGI